MPARRLAEQQPDTAHDRAADEQLHRQEHQRRRRRATAAEVVRAERPAERGPQHRELPAEVREREPAVRPQQRGDPRETERDAGRDRHRQRVAITTRRAEQRDPQRAARVQQRRLVRRDVLHRDHVDAGREHAVQQRHRADVAPFARLRRQALAAPQRDRQQQHAGTQEPGSAGQVRWQRGNHHLRHREARSPQEVDRGERAVQQQRGSGARHRCRRRGVGCLRTGAGTSAAGLMRFGSRSGTATRRSGRSRRDPATGRGAATLAAPARRCSR